MRLSRLLLSLIVALTPLPALAANGADAGPQVLAAGERRSTGPRAILVEVPQDEIATSIDLGRIPPNGGGGLIGALIIASSDDRAKRLGDTARSEAEVAAAPLRTALAGYDFAAKAAAETTAGFARIDWFAPATTTLARTDGPASRAAFATSAPGGDVAYVAWHYDLSPDFTQLRVTAQVTLARKPAGAGDAPLAYFHQTLVATSQLRDRSYVLRENAARWAADDGRLARGALGANAERIGAMIPMAVGLDAAQIQKWKRNDAPRAYAAGLYGPTVARDGEILTIWQNGLVTVLPAPL